MKFAKDLFYNLYEASISIINTLRLKSHAPSGDKKLREWGISDAAKMIGKTSQTLRKLEEEEKIPKARIIKKGKKTERRYNLKEINYLRDYFGTRPRKPDADIPPAVMAFQNFKGGVGKSTEAVLEAQQFALQGYRVLLVDLDNQATTTDTFGFRPNIDVEQDETALNALIDPDVDLTPMIKKTHWDGLDLIPANLSLYQAEMIIPNKIYKYAVKEKKQLTFHNFFHSALKRVYSNYDIIVLDCPPSLGFITMNALYAANAIMVEMPPVLSDFASTTQFFKMVSEVLEKLPPRNYAFVRILLTKYRNRTSAKDLHDRLKEKLGKYVMTNSMPETEVIPRAAGDMLTLLEIEKYEGHKQTFERALDQAAMVHQEVEGLVHKMWDIIVQQKEKAVELEEGA